MRLLIALLLALLVSVPAAAQEVARGTVAGGVNDETGAPIAGAVVILRQPGHPDRRVVTDAGGAFSFEWDVRAGGELIASAQGFATSREILTPVAPATGPVAVDVDFRLEPAGVAEQVTVTATRSERELGRVPASVNVMTRDEIERSPAVVADDLLRRLPAFSLFRRTSSLSSHPTAQGVSLRGIGPSGVSRTLVLIDGVPFNDPFGGWVYWTRMPLESADRIEIVDGSTSSLYGNYAMGGVINVVTRPALPRNLDMRLQYGNLNSPKVDLRASHVWGRLGATVDVSTFDTDGFPVVVEGERGLVDTNAAVNFTNANVRLNYDASDTLQLFAQGGYFREDRDNAKVTTVGPRLPEANNTRWHSFSAGMRSRLDGGHDLQARVFVDSERFESNFMAVPAATPARSIGRMTLRQAVPTTGIGASAQWSRAFGARHVLSAGADWRRVTGESQENALDAQTGTSVTLERRSGGRQQSAGVFVQDIIAVTDALTLTASARLDYWRNDDGHNLETSQPSGQPGPGHQPTLPVRTDTVGSPRVAALYSVNRRVSVWGSLGSGFRAPTLNELYRQFRVGTVLTLANNELGPERLIGGEAGIRLAPTSALNVRGTWYDNRVTDPVSNVTIATAGSSVTQQRQNLGRTRIYGFQADADYRVSSSWRISGGYLFSHATVTAFEANPDIEGNYLPQVPRHRGSIEVSYSNPRLVDVTLDLQAIGRQFDDDQNSRIVPGRTDAGLPAYALVSLYASRRVTPALDVFVGAQNLFDRQYFVGTLPTTVGTPRMINAGVRVRMGGR